MFSPSTSEFFIDFSEQGTFTAGAWSVTVPVMFDVSETGAELAGQRTGIKTTDLLVQETDYNANMIGAGLVVGTASFVVRDVDPYPQDGIRTLYLRRGHE